MAELRPELPPMPARMRGRPLDRRGYPVPFFVGYVDGEPDFRASDATKMRDCVKMRLCWMCGQPLGRYLSFVLGPMCALNRANGEPPCHLDCASWAACACPFLTRPRMRRNEHEMPEGAFHEAGILRNPGCVGVWTTRSYEVLRERSGVVFRIGEPEHVEWYCEGRPATRAEVEASVHSGIPILREQSLRMGDPAHVVEQLTALGLERLELLLPSA